MAAREQDDVGDVRADVVAREGVDDAEEDARGEGAVDAAHAAYHGDEEREGGELGAHLGAERREEPLHHAREPRHHGGEAHDQGAGAPGSMPQSSAPTSFSMIERMVLPSSVQRRKAKRAANTAITMAELARPAVRIGMPATSIMAWQLQRERELGELVVEVAVDDEREAQRQDEPEEQPLLAAEAVGREHQRAVDRDAEHAGGGDAARQASPGWMLCEKSKRGGDAADDGELAVREVEHAAEAVDQGDPHGEERELQALDDAVEEDGAHRIRRPRGRPS